MLKYNDTENTSYTMLWNKYRPPILKMMIAAETAPQQYQFYSNEFKALTTNAKSISFDLQVDNGKASNPIKMQAIAKDLLTVLQFSRKASELMENQLFEFRLDRQFLLHVTRLTKPDNSEIDSSELTLHN